MKKGISGWYGFDNSPSERILQIKNHGFDCVMLDWADDIVTNCKKEDYAFYANKYGVEIENGHLTFQKINDLWKDELCGDYEADTIINDIGLANKYGIETLVIHVSSTPNPPPISTVGLERFEKIVKFAIKNNVKLAFENLRKLDYLFAVTKMFDCDKIGYCYDSGHANCFTKGEEILSHFKNKIFTVHLHDNNSFQDEHLLPFYGNIDWNSEMKKLKQSNYKGNFNLEVASNNSDDLDEFLNKASISAEKLIKLYENA